MTEQGGEGKSGAHARKRMRRKGGNKRGRGIEREFEEARTSILFQYFKRTPGYHAYHEWTANI